MTTASPAAGRLGLPRRTLHELGPPWEATPGDQGQDTISLHPTLSAWATDPVPEARTATHTWQLRDLRHLSAVRREARALLLASSLPGDDGADAVERAVLALDELASNALRHGAPPACVQVTDQGPAWLVVATDSAPHRLPTPAHDRPAGQGGYGLHVITDLAASRGTTGDSVVKHVWALLPKT